MLVLCQEYHHLHYDTSMCCKAGIPAGQGPKHTRYAALFWFHARGFSALCKRWFSCFGWALVKDTESQF